VITISLGSGFTGAFSLQADEARTRVEVRADPALRVRGRLSAAPAPPGFFRFPVPIAPTRCRCGVSLPTSATAPLPLHRTYRRLPRRFLRSVSRAGEIALAPADRRGSFTRTEAVGPGYGVQRGASPAPKRPACSGWQAASAALLPATSTHAPALRCAFCSCCSLG